MEFPKFWISLTLYLLSLNIGTAQENYTLRTFTTKDGLPHNQVLSIAQDSTGFLWVATWDGISRYDGYEFKNYNHDPDDSTTIPYFSVFKVVVDRFKKVWVGTEIEKNAVYNPSDDNFIIPGSVKNDRFNRKIAVDQTGRVWQFNIETGLQRYDYQKNEYSDIRETDLYGNNMIFEKSGYSFRFDNNGNVWLYTENSKKIKVFFGILKDKETVSFRTFTMAKATKADPGSSEIFAVFRFNPYISSGGNMYLFSNWGLFQPDEESG